MAWQDSFATTQCAIADLYKNERFSDVFLVVEGESIPAHSLILKIRSPVLEAMLSETSPTQTEKKNVIELGDPISLIGIQPILSFMYDGLCDLDSSNIHDAWVCACYLQIESLKKRCVEFFKESLGIPTCIPILRALMHTENEVSGEAMKLCCDFVDANASTIFSSQDFFLDFPPSVLGFILERDSLEVSSELMLLKALLEFVSSRFSGKKELSQEETRQFLEENNLLWCIRYNLLEETALLKYARFLTPQEIISVRMLALGLISGDDRLTLQFKTSARTRHSNVHEVTRFREEACECNWSHHGTSDAIMVRFDQPVFLRGIKFYGPTVSPAKFDCQLWILSGSEVLGAEIYAEDNEPKTNCIRSIMCKRISFRENQWYDVKMCLQPSTGFSQVPHGRNGAPKTTLEIGEKTLNVDWSDSTSDDNGTDVEQGQIHSLIIEW